MKTIWIAFKERPTLVERVMRKVGEPFECPGHFALEFLRNGVAYPVRKWQMPIKAKPKAKAAEKPKPRPKPKRTGPARIMTEIERRDDALVGIVIPAYNPGLFLAPCLESLAHSDARDISEIILVDDGSDPPCAGDAVEIMKAHGLAGRVLRLRDNQGFQAAVNAGAEQVAGDQLLMLSVDTVVTPSFLSPLLATLDANPLIGVVGNKHLSPNGKVDSAGSVWSWSGRVYRHRVRDEPADPDKAAELDMVTFACCLIRREVWDEAGGVSPNVPGLYWEDTDFCMRVRRRGWRIVYEPSSTIEHYGKHSTLKDPQRRVLGEINARFFRRTWAEKGYPERFARERGSRCDDRTRIIVGMITLNEEEFVQAAIESVYDDADLIVVPVGAVDRAVAAGLCGPNGYPTDATMDILRDFPDPADKIKVIGPQMWGPEKSAMRNAILDHCKPGDMVVMLDADEVMYPGKMWELFAQLRHADVLRPKREDHWNNLDTIADGHGWMRIWEPRIFRFKPGMRYTQNHGCPDDLGRPDIRLDEAPWAHYAYVKPIEKLRRKVDYYRQVYPISHIDADYIDNVFLRWREYPEAVVNGPGTYVIKTLRGGARSYKERHPPQIEKRILDGTMPGADW